MKIHLHCHVPLSESDVVFLINSCFSFGEKHDECGLSVLVGFKVIGYDLNLQFRGQPLVK
jgi:hypothetical protein